MKLLGDTVDKTSQTMDELKKHSADVIKANKDEGWHGALTLKKNTKDTAAAMKDLNDATKRELDLLNKVAAAGTKIADKQAAGVGGTDLARAAGLGPRMQEQVGMLSRLTGKLPTTELLGRFKTFGTRATSIAVGVAQATGKMMTGHELDQALSLNQNKLIKFFTFIQKHHRLPKWLLEVDTTKGKHGVDTAAAHATKLARKHFKVTFLDGTGAARKGLSVTQSKAMALNQKKFQIHMSVDTSGIFSAFAGMQGFAYQQGGAMADRFNAGFKAAAKIGSPSKVMEENGKMMIRGLTKGIVKEAGGVKQAFQSIVSTMEQTWSGLHDTMQSSFGTLFQGPRGDIIGNIMGFGAKPGIGLLTQDLKGQVRKFSTWMHAVDRLRSMGAPPGLVAQLWELGPDSLPAVQSILAGTRRQRRTYFHLFKKEDRLVQSATQRAFLNQAKIWKQMGHTMAFGLLTGLHDARPELLRFFKNLAHEMFHTFKKHNKSHSPSRLYYDEGRNMMLGLQAGLNSVAVAVPGPVGFSGRGGGGSAHALPLPRASLSRSTIGTGLDEAFAV